MGKIEGHGIDDNHTGRMWKWLNVWSWGNHQWFHIKLGGRSLHQSVPGNVLGPGLFRSFLNSLDKDTDDFFFIAFEIDPKLEGTAATLDDSQNSEKY